MTPENDKMCQTQFIGGSMDKYLIDPFNESDFRKVLSDLLSIPSVKSEPTAEAPYGTATVQALDCILRYAEANGLLAVNLDNRVGYAQWGSGEKMVAVLCHLDVVPPGEGWDSNPFSLVIRDGLLIGRGITDNKGPAVCALFALLRLKAIGYQPSSRIRLIFGLDEEHGCTCMKHYVSIAELPDTGFTPDASFPAIYAEKGILQIRLSGPGSSTVEATGGDAYNMVPSSCSITSHPTGECFNTSGIQAHASTPEKGENAIIKAVFAFSNSNFGTNPVFDLILRFSIQGEDLKNLITVSQPDISGSLTINTGMMRITADESSVGIDIRYPVKSNMDDIFREVSQKASEFGLVSTIIDHLSPLYTDPQAPIMVALRSVYERHLSEVYRASYPGQPDIPEEFRSADPIAIGGGTYARSAPGIVAFGPRFPWEENRMHQKNESCSEKSLLASIDLYQDALTSLCQTICIQ